MDTNRLGRLANISSLVAEADLLSVSGMSRSIRSETTIGLGVLSGRAIMAVGELVLRGVERVQLQRTLLAASTNVRNSQRHSIPLGHGTVKDLLELQRVGLYPENIREKALSILLPAMALHSDSLGHVMDILLSWSSIELQLFLKQLAIVKLGNSDLSNRCTIIFPTVLAYLLKEAPKIIYDTFDLQDVCCLLCDKDAKELTQVLVQDKHIAPMDMFLSSLASFTADQRIKDNAAIMVSYLHRCPRYVLSSAIRHLVARITIHLLPPLDPTSSREDDFRTLLGILEFTILLANKDISLHKELLTLDIGDRIAQLSLGCLAALDTYSPHESEVLLSLCLACHRVLLQLHRTCPSFRIFPPYLREVLTVLIRTTQKWALPRSEGIAFRRELYEHIIELVSDKHDDENKRAGWCLLLSDIWAGNISYFVDWLKTKSVEAEMDIVLHMVLHKLHNWELNTWLFQMVEDWASMWSDSLSSGPMCQDLKARCSSSHCLRQWRLPFKNPCLEGVPTEDILLILLYTYQDKQFLQEEPSFLHRLSTLSTIPEEVFTHHYPFRAHVVYLSNIPRGLLRRFIRGIVTEYKQMNLGEETIFPTLILVTHLILAHPDICMICQEEDIIGILMVSWWTNRLYRHKRTKSPEVRVWVLVALGALMCQIPLADACPLMSRFTAEHTSFFVDIHFHYELINEALRIHPVTHHFLVLSAQMLRSKQVIDICTSRFQLPACRSSAYILGALIPRKVKNMYKLRYFAISVLMASNSSDYRDTFVQAIRESHHLTTHLSTLLLNVEDTHKLIRDEGASMCHQWARVTARLLDIIILACLKDSVAYAVYNARDEFRTMLSRFRAAKVEDDAADVKEELRQLCDDLEGYLSILPRGLDLDSLIDI